MGGGSRNQRTPAATSRSSPALDDLQWEVAPGVQALLMGSNPNGVEAVGGTSPDDLVAVAEALEQVDADDPRIVEPPPAEPS